jgi:hypothetical protein
VNLPGGLPTESDLAHFAQCGIDAAVVRSALIRRVDSITAAEMFGKNGGGDYAGVLFPYTDLADPTHIVEFTLRLDNPPLEGRDGQSKATRKYLWPAGRGNRLYTPPDVGRDLLRLPTFRSSSARASRRVWRCGPSPGTA